MGMLDKLIEKDLTEGERHFRRLIKAHESGQSPPEDTLQFLVNAGRQILRGANPKKVLKLEKPRGNKKLSGFIVLERIELVRAICCLMSEYKLSKEQAIELMANSRSKVKGYSFDSIRHYYDEYQGYVRKTSVPEDIETLFMGGPPMWRQMVMSVMADSNSKK